MNANPTRCPSNLQAPNRAFSRVELLATICAVTLLLLVVIPALAGTKSGSDRAVCAANLRHIGYAVHQWWSDSGQPHGPWWVPYAGGGYGYPRLANSAREWSSLSNELITPKLLACPSDEGVRVAADWAGLQAVQEQGVSYMIGVHAGTHPYRPQDVIVAADRNMRSDGVSDCSAGFYALFTIRSHSSSLAWTNAVHGTYGNLLTYDGRVEFTSTPRLKEYFMDWVNGYHDDTAHFIKAR